VRRLSLSGRREAAKSVFATLWVAGIVLTFLLPSHGSNGVRYSVGIPLTVGVLYSGLRWALLARQLRAAAQPNEATPAARTT
jgi:hypothetical protein